MYRFHSNSSYFWIFAFHTFLLWHQTLKIWPHSLCVTVIIKEKDPPRAWPASLPVPARRSLGRWIWIWKYCAACYLIFRAKCSEIVAWFSLLPVCNRTCWPEIKSNRCFTFTPESSSAPPSVGINDTVEWMGLKLGCSFVLDNMSILSISSPTTRHTSDYVCADEEGEWKDCFSIAFPLLWNSNGT